MSGSRHVMILASAGSGKTYALTNRFLTLMVQGVSPERIAALTFTREAAGEFFDEILAKLARAAGDPTEGQRLADEIGLADPGPASYRKLIRLLIEAAPRLRLGTLDSFFSRIVRAFPFELGLAGDFEMLAKHAALMERARALRLLFLDDSAQGGREFIEAFKLATFGREEKRLLSSLHTYLDEHHAVYLAAPDPDLWGNPDRIWPDGCPWPEKAGEMEPALRSLRQWAETAGLDEKQSFRWGEFFAGVEAWSPGTELGGGLKFILDKALQELDKLTAGPAELTMDRKKQRLSAAAGAALAGIARGIVGGELKRHREMTRGIHALLRKYETVYDAVVRRGGKLTFDDVRRLLEPIELGSGSPGPGDERRILIDFRLDGEIDHWLLDEFQDTSFGQWSILRNLVDEAVQDPERRRSFFCVGDVKQAIFGWRGGDPGLFRQILDHYNAAAPGTIREEFLDESRRSGPPLIALINAVFGAASALRELLPGGAGESWNAGWRPHRSAMIDRAGQAALLFAADEAGRWQTALDLLRELAPAARGLDCAVLVQDNKTATQLADFLRSEGIVAVANSDLHVCTDHPVGAALLALVQAAVHPGDRLAWEHVGMSPIGPTLAAHGISSLDALALRLPGEWHAEGFGRTMEAWLRRLEPALAPGDRFSRERARQFVAAARDFDETGSRDPDEFIAFMQRHTLRDSESAGAVRVMTIHKAKGLGFDIVLLPDLGGDSLDGRRSGLAVQKRADCSTEWVLNLPPKMLWTQDPVLRAHGDEAAAAAGYEKLCLLYVALTRAKRGLYLISEPVGKSVSRNFPCLLENTLGSAAVSVRVGALGLTGSWTAGDPDWHLHLPPPEAASAAPPEAEPLSAHAAVPSVRRAVRRAAGDAAGAPLQRLFSLEPAGEADFGARVHTLLAGIEWASAAERAAVRWPEDGPAEAEAAACLRAPDLSGVWERPAGNVEVWRERAFEAVTGKTWVTGRFDRVIVARDAAGRPESAAIFDFKTDRVESETEVKDAVARHIAQLMTYREAAAALTGLPLSAIRCEIVFTRLRRREPVPFPT